MSAPLPPWEDVVTAVLVVSAGLLALVSALGLVRLGSFFQRIHASALATSGATWLLTLATFVQFSSVRGQLFAHALLIGLFIALTAPVTTVFLLRAALFRGRLAGQDLPGALTGPGTRHR